MGDLPIRSLIEPVGTTGLCKALPAVNNAQAKIAMLNLGPQITLEVGSQIAEATPLWLQTQDAPSEKISSLGGKDTADQLIQDL